MSEVDTVVAYAVITVLIQRGIPAKTLTTHLAKLLPKKDLPQFEKDVMAVITRMTGDGS